MCGYLVGRQAGHDGRDGPHERGGGGRRRGELVQRLHGAQQLADVLGRSAGTRLADVLLRDVTM